MARHAPSKHYRNGLSLVDVMRKFPEDAAAAAGLSSSVGPIASAAPATTATTSSPT